MNQKNYNFKILKSSGNLWSSDNARILSAELKEQQCKIQVFQHGGSYGLKNDTVNFFDKYLSDIFYCWGPPLSKKEKRIHPLELSRINNINKNYNNRIIVPISLPSHLLKEISSGYACQVYDIYLNDLDIFLKNLDKPILEKVTLRLQPQNFKNIFSRKELIKYFSKKYKEIEIIEPEHNFKEDLKNYKFCVITIDSTTFLETLSSNIEFICFWRKNYTILHNKFKKIYNKLYSSNLFFEDPKIAAEMVNKIFFEKSKNHKKNNEKIISYLRKELCNLPHS